MNFSCIFWGENQYSVVVGWIVLKCQLGQVVGSIVQSSISSLFFCLLSSPLLRENVYHCGFDFSFQFCMCGSILSKIEVIFSDSE